MRQWKSPPRFSCVKINVYRPRLEGLNRFSYTSIYKVSVRRAALQFESHTNRINGIIFAFARVVQHTATKSAPLADILNLHVHINALVNHAVSSSSLPNASEDPVNDERNVNLKTRALNIDVATTCGESAIEKECLWGCDGIKSCLPNRF